MHTARERTGILYVGYSVSWSGDLADDLASSQAEPKRSLAERKTPETAALGVLKSRTPVSREVLTELLDALHRL
ncbi:hypothetical protein [Saccharopolyspora pogona]|uniref:hypothetical protein n=1 Tax=Saccharopolyspora pogona TaxID=333966 RepID=UPI0016837AF3|nr:hypothetical protein [Saccharopolyspora pogona]